MSTIVQSWEEEPPSCALPFPSLLYKYLSAPLWKVALPHHTPGSASWSGLVWQCELSPPAAAAGASSEGDLVRAALQRQQESQRAHGVQNVCRWEAARGVGLLAGGISSCVRRPSLDRVTTCWLAQKSPAYWFCSAHMNWAVILFPLTRGFSCASSCQCVNWMCVFHSCLSFFQWSQSGILQRKSESLEVKGEGS